jgi:phosphoribosylanthranilate isomerase
MTWVKICGITNLDDALVAVDAGADAVGFVFYEQSPRSVTIRTAQQIVEKLPSGLDKVGVFVNQSPEQVSAMAEEAGMTAVQLHGDEYRDPEPYSRLGKTFFSLPVTDVLAKLGGASVFKGLPHYPKSSAILLDSGNQDQRGGTGKSFAWGEAYGFVSILKKLHPVVIAGGLTPSNVGWAADFLKPWGVDVASGVEQRPGKKDPEKVRAFVRAAKQGESRAG